MLSIAMLVSVANWATVSQGFRGLKERCRDKNRGR